MPATNANEVINKYIEISQFGQDAIDVWLRNAPNEAALLFTSFPQTQGRVLHSRILITSLMVMVFLIKL